jgi:type IX secretion system PorP/SprF family membrane protein
MISKEPSEGGPTVSGLDFAKIGAGTKLTFARQRLFFCPAQKNFDLFRQKIGFLRLKSERGLRSAPNRFFFVPTAGPPMKRLLTILALCSAFGPSLAAQDFVNNVFSQFYAAPVLLNPAFTGTTFQPRISLTYRNQWLSLPNAYVTYAAAYDQFFERANSGFGLMAIADQAGDGIWNTVGVNASYSYNIQVNRDWNIRGGAQVGYFNSRIDWSRLVFLDQINPLTGPTDGAGNPNPTQQPFPGAQSVGFLDLGLGALVFSEHFYGGLSFHHVNTPNLSLINGTGNRGALPMRFSAHAGGEFFLGKSNKKKERPFISPNLLFTKQKQFHQINLTTYFGYGPVFGGLGYRHAFGNGDAAIFTAGFRQGLFRLGYSYDLTLSSLANSRTGGSHEISVILNFDKTPGNQRRNFEKRYGNCFDIFK